MIKVEENKISALKNHPGYPYAKSDILQLFAHYKNMNAIRELSNAHINKTMFWMSVENYLKAEQEPWKMPKDKRESLADKAYSEACEKYLILRGEEFNAKERKARDDKKSQEEIETIRTELIEEEEDFSYEPFDD